MEFSLGMEKRKFLFQCMGVLKQDQARDVIKNFIAFIGMTPARHPRIDTYPFEEGGGEGYTGFFPLMESYIVVDVYTNLSHTEILISTCKPERLTIPGVLAFLNKNIGKTQFMGVL